MAIADFPDYIGTDPNSPTPIGAVPWRDANGVWHFGGSESRGGSAPGMGLPGGDTPATPPATPPAGGAPTVPGAGGFNLSDFLTELTGGVLSGLGSIFGQQRRQSFQGTAADPVQALSGVQAQLSDAGGGLRRRMESAPTLSAPDAASLRRATDLGASPGDGDLSHLRASLRAMGVNL